MIGEVLLLLLVALFFRCNSSNQQREGNLETVAERGMAGNGQQAGSGPQFLNNINIQQRGNLTISHASLVDEEGKLIDQSNTIRANEAFYLRLAVQRGWRTKNGTVSLGATQSIKTNLGEPVLQTGDLFAGDPVIEEEKGRLIQLKATITQTRSDVTFYTIHFRVWDKHSEAEVSGDYKIQLSR